MREEAVPQELGCRLRSAAGSVLEPGTRASHPRPGINAYSCIYTSELATLHHPRARASVSRVRLVRARASVHDKRQGRQAHLPDIPTQVGQTGERAAQGRGVICTHAGEVHPFGVRRNDQRTELLCGTLHSKKTPGLFNAAWYIACASRPSNIEGRLGSWTWSVSIISSSSSPSSPS